MKSCSSPEDRCFRSDDCPEVWLLLLLLTCSKQHIIKWKAISSQMVTVRKYQVWCSSSTKLLESRLSVWHTDAVHRTTVNDFCTCRPITHTNKKWEVFLKPTGWCWPHRGQPPWRGGGALHQWPERFLKSGGEEPTKNWPNSCTQIATRYQCSCAGFGFTADYGFIAVYLRPHSRLRLYSRYL